MNEQVHYIWVGGLGSDAAKASCSMGPKRLAQLYAEQANESEPPSDNVNVINMWVQASEVEQAETLFQDTPNVQIRNIDEFVHDFEWGLGDAEQVRAIYDNPDIPNVAKKDLLTYVVLNKEGGYFFDTSTFFTEVPELPSLDNNQYKVMLNRDSIEDPERRWLLWTTVDVWMMASAANSMFTSVALNDCMKTYDNHSDRSYGGAMFAGASQYAFDILANDGRFSKNVFEPPSSETLDTVKKHALLYESGNVSQEWFVPELNMSKFSLGFWREGTVDAFWMMKKEIYRYLEENDFDFHKPERLRLYLDLQTVQQGNSRDVDEARFKQLWDKLVNTKGAFAEPLSQDYGYEVIIDAVERYLGGEFDLPDADSESLDSCSLLELLENITHASVKAGKRSSSERVVTSSFTNSRSSASHTFTTEESEPQSESPTPSGSKRPGKR